MTLEIKNRLTGETIISASEGEPKHESAAALVVSAVRSGANLRGANLRGAGLSGADLYYAKGVVSFGPVGREKRIGHAVANDGGPRVKLGCFWGPLTDALAAIEAKYGAGSSYAALVSAAGAVLTEGAGG